MKKKIVMKVQINCQKCRKNVLKIAAGSYGVEFVGIEGGDKDQLVVIGEGVDAANLAGSLRKKVGYADIISLSEVKDK
ncbi:Heavy metal transport/detoxification protein [Quillaja saponaria]|uniref:Heavy metal transport/detoxification protein n=1 Tax=Quillaja saponaria TaxID=32244 RepID=A0AAD7PUG9_QUISA|nr:Heavy metal transport/detoxification protein [Quillaja saponaria]